MKMDSKKLMNLLKDRLKDESRTFQFDSKQDTFRIENVKTGKGITIELSRVVANYERVQEKAIEEMVLLCRGSIEVMGEEHRMEGKEKSIFPVIRSTSFPTDAEEGNPFLIDEHTAETRIFYALDLGNTYRLIDEKMLQVNIGKQIAFVKLLVLMFDHSRLDVKTDTVAGNTFYFLNTNDGYDASQNLK